MTRQPPRYTLTGTFLPFTTLFRSGCGCTCALARLSCVVFVGRRAGMRAFLGSVVALGVAVSAPMASAQTAPGTTSTQGIKAGVYQVDPAHTQVVAKYLHLAIGRASCRERVCQYV